MIYKIILMVIVYITYILGNMYWHKKIIDGKWEYTIYSTIIIIIYSLSVLIAIS